MSKKKVKPPKVKLPRANMAQAKAAWDAHPNTEENKRSYRKVIAMLQAKGVDCAVSTLLRWVDADWSPVQMGRAQKLSKQIDDKAAEHDGKATNPDDTEREEARAKRQNDELGDEAVSIEQLQRKVMRKDLIAQYILSDQIIRRAPVLVERDPAMAIRALELYKQPSPTTINIIPTHHQQPGNGDGARVVDGRVLPEPSETAIAIADFKARRREVA